MPRRILSIIPRHWQYFISSIAVVLVLPVLPIFLELAFLGRIRADTLILTGAIYPVTIIASSSSAGLFGLAAVISVPLAAAYGRVMEGASSSIQLWAIVLSVIAIGGVFVLHAFERDNRHVVGGEPLF